MLRLQDKLLLLIINLFGWLRLLLLTAIIIRVHDHDIMVMVMIACDLIHRRTVIVVWRKLLGCLKIKVIVNSEDHLHVLSCYCPVALYCSTLLLPGLMIY